MRHLQRSAVKDCGSESTLTESLNPMHLIIGQVRKVTAPKNVATEICISRAWTVEQFHWYDNNPILSLERNVYTRL
jgi:hypothetical protein